MNNNAVGDLVFASTTPRVPVWARLGRQVEIGIWVGWWRRGTKEGAASGKKVHAVAYLRRFRQAHSITHPLFGFAGMWH